MIYHFFFTKNVLLIVFAYTCRYDGVDNVGSCMNEGPSHATSPHHEAIIPPLKVVPTLHVGPSHWLFPTTPTVTDDNHSFARKRRHACTRRPHVRGGPHHSTWPRRLRLIYTCPHALPPPRRVSRYPGPTSFLLINPAFPFFLDYSNQKQEKKKKGSRTNES